MQRDGRAEEVHITHIMKINVIHMVLWHVMCISYISLGYSANSIACCRIALFYACFVKAAEHNNRTRDAK